MTSSKSGTTPRSVSVTPRPRATLLNAYLADRPNMTTATNSDSCWLSPSRRAGQAMDPEPCASSTFRPNAHVTAIRQVVLQTFENPEARYLEGAPARRKAALLARSVDDLGDLLFGQVPLGNSDDDS